ncbi:MAG: hypothetical protein HWE21_08560 [Cytophagia bacterium]|nr:hypothetical protein [Cytophagia bacterium]
MKQLVMIVCLSLASIAYSHAQEPGNVANPQLVIVYLEDKSEITGELISENDTEIVINSISLGLLTFQKSEIKRIIYLDAKGRMPNPNPTRYFIGQSAHTHEKGEGYYQNIYGLFNLVSYGVTDRFSVIGGVELVSLFSGNPFLFANAKYGIPIAPKLNVAASVTYITVAGSLADFSAGTINGLVTYGNKEHHVTVGSGYAFANGEIDNSGILTLGGITRLSKRFAFITENYILTSGEDAIISGGLRYIAKKLTIDLMYFEGGFPAIDIVLKL